MTHTVIHRTLSTLAAVAVMTALASSPISAQENKRQYKPPSAQTLTNEQKLSKKKLSRPGEPPANAGPPAASQCWYWMDASQTQGFWDYCQ